MEIEQRIYNGNRAKEVLENEAFIQAFADIEEEYISKWMTSPAGDPEGREKIWTYLMLLKKLRGYIQTTLETGKLANLELEYQRSVAQKAKDFLGIR